MLHSFESEIEISSPSLKMQAVLENCAWIFGSFVQIQYSHWEDYCKILLKAQRAKENWNINKNININFNINIGINLNTKINLYP